MKNQNIKQLFQNPLVVKRFNEILGKKAQGFISSVLQIVSNSTYLQGVDPQTILTASITASVLDLPINQNLGFAWIVPYKGKAQFQMGWKGYVQLALRTGQYKNINVTEVFENQFNSFNSLTEEIDADFSIDGEGKIIGYAGFFKLINGMEKTVYWTKEKVIKHAKKYSQAYSSKSSPWSDKHQFDAMAKKTVLKLMLSKWGIMSIELQTANLSDQSVQEVEGDYKYIDNPTTTIDVVDKDNIRILEYIEGAENLEQLNDLVNSLDENQINNFKENIDSQKSKLS